MSLSLTLFGVFPRGAVPTRGYQAVKRARGVRLANLIDILVPAHAVANAIAQAPLPGLWLVIDRGDEDGELLSERIARPAVRGQRRQRGRQAVNVEHGGSPQSPI